MAVVDSKAMVPATAEDTAFAKHVLARMPMCGHWSESVVAVEALPLPPINSRGSRDSEGWTAVYEITVQPDMINGLGGIHGAASAWLVDMFTGTSVRRLATPTFQSAGPSVTIDMTYYSAAIAGQVLRVETTVDRVGGQLSMVRCLILDKETGRRIAFGMHTIMRNKAGEKAKAKL